VNRPPEVLEAPRGSRKPAPLWWIGLLGLSLTAPILVRDVPETSTRQVVFVP
jgi:hypothetical protein